MAFHLIALAAIAFAAAGIFLALRTMLGERLPRWTMPALIGLAMIAFTVWTEYSWERRVTAELPEGMTVVWRDDAPQPLRPWTFLAPMTTRFTAIDTTSAAVHPSLATIRRYRVFSFARWQNVEEGLMAVDCKGGRRALLVAAAEITEAGELKGAEWQPAPAGDVMQAVACEGG
jgi:hypothetical protein